MVEEKVYVSNSIATSSPSQPEPEESEVKITVIKMFNCNQQNDPCEKTQNQNIKG